MKKIIDNKNIFLLIITIFVLLHLSLNLYLYFINRNRLEKDIIVKVEKLSNFIKTSIEENYSRNYHIENMFYEMSLLDFRNRNFLNNANSYIELDKELFPVSGNLIIELGDFEEELLNSIYKAKLKVVELMAFENEIFLAGYENGNLIIAKYSISQEIVESLDINKTLQNVVKSYDFYSIDIYNQEGTLLKIENSEKDVQIRRVEETIEIADKLNNRQYSYNMDIAFDITADSANIRKNYYDFVYSLVIIIIIYILTFSYRFYQNRYEENEKILKEKEKEILMGSMAAGVAHEIRNPLNSINYSIEYLKNVIKEEKYLKYFGIIEKEIRRMNETIEEFLNIRKDMRINRRKCNIKEILTESVNLLNIEAEKKGIEIIFECKHEYNYSCDEAKLKEVFNNIIKNSIEAFDKKSEEKTVKIMQKNEKIVFVDNGKGMKKQEVNNIFNLYFTTKKTGNGIGMYRVKKILDAHNIGIEIESQEGKGTKVTMTFQEGK